MKKAITLKQDFKIALYFLGLIKKISKSYIPLIITASFFMSLTPFINIIMSKFIIDELLASHEINKLISLVAITVIGNMIIGFVNRLLDTKVDIANIELKNEIELHLGKHIMKIDFECLEDTKILDLKERALAAIKQQDSISKIIDDFRKILQTSISIVGLITIISTLNVFFIFGIFVIVILNAFVFKKSQESQFNFHKMLAPLNRKFGYYSKLTTDFSMAKDVRIFNISPFILKKVDAYHSEIIDGFGKMYGDMGFYKGLSNVNIQIEVAGIYAFMVYKVVAQAITLGSFTMYITAAINFSDNISAFINSFVEFRQMCKYLDSFAAFEAIPIKKSTGIRKTDGIKNVTIEFKNVYFKYPGSSEYTLKNVSIKINNGEKLSIVGENGAGKTTFIKLLCRLYDPEMGEIFINGVNIKEYEYNEYMKLLSVVFQDYKIFSLTIRENIAFDNIDGSTDERIVNAIRKSGLSDKILSLENGIDTFVYKVFDEKGVEFSGGESQKLALARAVFKDAPIIILDEPTAALDPYSEYELFSNFNELIENSTAIYISHRLSSCKFCDKIAFFENGEITEYGSHNELVSRGQRYAEMWNAQAKYYID